MERNSSQRNNGKLTGDYRQWIKNKDISGWHVVQTRQWPQVNWGHWFELCFSPEAFWPFSKKRNWLLKYGDRIFFITPLNFQATLFWSGIYLILTARNWKLESWKNPKLNLETSSDLRYIVNLLYHACSLTYLLITVALSLLLLC